MERNERRILVVDDDDAIRALLLTILRRRGFRVDTARNGVEALEKIERCRYLVVLLDLMMPRLSGYDVLAQLSLKTSPERPLVIVLTAGTEPRDLDPNLVVGTMRKPFDIEMLVDTLAACVATLEKTSSQQLAECPPPESERPAPTDPNEPN